MDTRAFITVLLLLFVTGVGQAQQVPSSVDGPGKLPDFAGSWEMDYGLSEHPRDKLRYLNDVTRSHYQRLISRRDQNASAIRAARAQLQGLIDLGRLTEIITRSQVLTIEQSRDDIVVQRQGNFALTCDFQNREMTDNALGKKVCAWEDDQLVFHLKLPGGLTVRHRLTIAANGERLNVATTLSSDDIAQQFSINRVYIPFEPGEGMYTCEYTLAKKKTCHLGAPD